MDWFGDWADRYDTGLGEQGIRREPSAPLTCSPSSPASTRSHVSVWERRSA
jgi:hypothetical protein